MVELGSREGPVWPLEHGSTCLTKGDAETQWANHMPTFMYKLAAQLRQESGLSLPRLDVLLPATSQTYLLVQVLNPSEGWFSFVSGSPADLLALCCTPLTTTTWGLYPLGFGDLSSLCDSLPGPGKLGQYPAGEQISTRLQWGHSEHRHWQVLLLFPEGKPETEAPKCRWHSHPRRNKPG